MPYIDQSRRAELVDFALDPQTPGELNFLLTRLAIRYLNIKGLTYGTINDVLGAFDGASKEFYRRVAVPYEDGKIVANGDVY